MKNSKGFSLIQMLIVVAIVGIMSVMFLRPVHAQEAIDPGMGLQIQVLKGVYIEAPFNHLYASWLINFNNKPAPMSLTGIQSPVISFNDKVEFAIGTVTSTGYDNRATYSIIFNYKNANPALVGVDAIKIGAFWSSIFDGTPTMYGINSTYKFF